MADVTEIQAYRDGGTIEFRVTGSDADGLYRLQTPLLGTPRPLFKNSQPTRFRISRRDYGLCIIARVAYQCQ